MCCVIRGEDGENRRISLFKGSGGGLVLRWTVVPRPASQSTKAPSKAADVVVGGGYEESNP